MAEHIVIILVLWQVEMIFEQFLIFVQHFLDFIQPSLRFVLCTIFSIPTLQSKDGFVNAFAAIIRSTGVPDGHEAQ